MGKTKPNLLNSLRDEQENTPRKAGRAAPKAHPAPTPAKTTMIGGHFDHQVKSSFRMIQEKHPEKTMRELIVEAYNLLFQHYKVPPSAR